MSENVNTVAITGNLTRDPELRHTQGGTAVCNLRVAVTSRRKEGEKWVDKPNYFSVTVWGALGENAAKYLAKGRPVGIKGRLDWKERGEGDSYREYVSIIAETVQFLGSGKKADSEAPPEAPEAEAVPAGAGANGSVEEDIPF